MKPRFQADADLNQDITDGLTRREPLIDFKRAIDVGLTGIEDSEVLLICANDNRILVTHDRKTMPHHFGRFILSNNSPGVCIVPQSLSILSSIEYLLIIWAASEHEEWQNLIFDIPF